MRQFTTIRRALFAHLTTALRGQGFSRQKREFSNFFTRFHEEGSHSIIVEADARFDLSVRLRYGLSFRVVWPVLQEIGRRMLISSGNEDLRIPEAAQEEGARCYPLFTCFAERLEGIPDWSQDTISEPDDLIALCERTLARIHSRGLGFLAKYGTLAAVLRVIDADSQDWCLLENLRCQYLVAAAATVYAVRGYHALSEFVRRHDDDPDLEGHFRDQITWLVDAAREQQRGSR
ncbi:MAG TPA: hypothetical protein PKC45_16865 [Gemmatales bacterium]|nr:hypothetical protein [Gemmatales bacterium]